MNDNCVVMCSGFCVVFSRPVPLFTCADQCMEFSHTHSLSLMLWWVCGSMGACMSVCLCTYVWKSGGTYMCLCGKFGSWQSERMRVRAGGWVWVSSCRKRGFCSGQRGYGRVWLSIV